MSTRDDILSLLRREKLTITEIADRLELARNAVVIPLQKLESDGLIEGSTRRGKRVGKPARQYAVVSGHEDVASRAYPSFTETLVRSLGDHLSRDQIEHVMRQVGREMAADVPADSEADFSERLKAATDFVDNLGAETVVEVNGNRAVVQSFTCPLGRAVRQEPCVCQVVAAFLSSVTGAQVEEQCERGERLYCKFRVTG